MKNLWSRRFISLILITVFILDISSVHAWSWWSWGETQTRDMDMRFSTIYPKSFWQSTTGRVTAIVGGAIAIGAITYFTAGGGTAAGAGTIATFIGGTIGSLKGLSGIAAINAGLAMLGGGSIASGGFGVLGGITVLSVIGDIAMAAAIDTAVMAIPKNSTHDFLEIIKLRMFYDKVSSIVEEDLNDLEESIDDEALDKVSFFFKPHRK